MHEWLPVWLGFDINPAKVGNPKWSIKPWSSMLFTYALRTCRTCMTWISSLITILGITQQDRLQFWSKSMQKSSKTYHLFNIKKQPQSSNNKTIKKSIKRPVSSSWKAHYTPLQEKPQLCHFYSDLLPYHYKTSTDRRNTEDSFCHNSPKMTQVRLGHEGTKSHASQWHHN